jgi:alpha-N-arabinofuranosidase
MGRETFLAAVTWENDWPVVNPGLGRLSEMLRVNLDNKEPESASLSEPGTDKYYDFTKIKEFGPEVLTLRNPSDDAYELVENRGLKLKCSKSLITSLGDVSYIAIRQDCHNFEIGCTINTENLLRGASAGLIVFQNHKYNIRFEVSNWVGYVLLTRDGEEIKYETCPLGNIATTLIIRVIGLKAFFFIMTKQGPVLVAGNVDISDLSTEVAGGFVGCTVGIYAHDYDDKREIDLFAGFKDFYYNRMPTTEEKKYMEEDV